jgi:hypothetical protein
VPFWPSVQTHTRRLRNSALYTIHDRLVANRTSRHLYRDRFPQLDETQRRIVGDLHQEGIAIAEIGTLMPDPASWLRLVQSAATFRSDTERSDARASDTGAGDKRKRHLIRRMTWGAGLSLDDPWIQLCIDRRIIDIVNAYLGLCSKLFYIDQWYTAPRQAGTERVSSQRWHRDVSDRHLVKMFVYLDEVDAGAGPFEYVRGSARGGPYADLWPWRPFGPHLYPPEPIERLIPSAAIATVTGQAGTVILCDTSGFHRGGYATTNPRLMAVSNYASPAALGTLAERNFTLDPSHLPADVPDVVRFALS